uniref:Uncharacterized protein n=1 Tax=Setaria italica TaxID=4555 RepID=K3Z132_SETIT
MSPNMNSTLMLVMSMSLKKHNPCHLERTSIIFQQRV